jgi:hypothetical protein
MYRVHEFMGARPPAFHLEASVVGASQLTWTQETPAATTEDLIEPKEIVVLC